MEKIVLYHGTLDKVFTPIYGKGNEKHDYGKGFYLTESIDLAKEWAVCRPNEENGWVHKYELDCKDLKVLDFQKLSVLTWLAELMKHRDAADSKRYRMLAAKFIEKYGVETEGYDVIKGWRANASYFYIAKEFVRDNIDIDILEELLSLGGLGIQYCIKSEKAYNNLHELKEELVPVDYSEFNERYNDRDVTARKNMRDLINSDANEVTKVFSTLLLEVRRMRAYSDVYLGDVVENQGKLFDYVANTYPDKDTEDFINAYMTSKTRQSIDQAKAYVNTMDAKELWEYFKETEHYSLQQGKAMEGFMPDWIGEFYAYYQWYYNIPSAEVNQKIDVDFLKKAYYGLHDLDLDLAVQKVGEI